jgi:peptide/nickel transport system permease protein
VISMRRAILRRLMLMAITVVAGGFLAAVLVRYAPGFGTDERQLDGRLNRESQQAIRNAAGEERSVGHYYIASLGRALRGDLGTSRCLQRPVRQLLAERSVVTLIIVAKGLGTAWVAAVLLLLATSVPRSRSLDAVCNVACGALLCLPSGAVALLLLLCNGPGYLALALVVFPRVHRYLWNLVVATAELPHIITAKAKGISQTRVLLWHVIPVIRREALALAGVSIAMALSAAIPVEALCGIPGVGQLAWQSALARDVPVLIYVSLLVIAIIVLANSGADVLAGEGSGAS